MGEAKRNKRDCAAAGRVISPAECGENRGSHYACPANCPHNPWSPANYSRALCIDSELTSKMMRRLAQEGIDPTELPPTMEPEANLHWFFVGKFFRERDTAGRTFVERWAQQQWQGLENDERMFLEWTSRVKVAVIEVQRVIDGERCEVVDLLDPTLARAVVQDRKLAGMAVRFSQLLGWMFPMPHYHRLHGAALAIPEVNGLDATDVVREVARHLGGPAEVAALRDWLADHWKLVEDAFVAIDDAFRWRMIESADAKFCAASYRLRGSAETLARRLDALPCVAPDDLADTERAEGFTLGRSWFDEPAPVEPLQTALPLKSPTAPVLGRPLLGRVLIAADRVRVETGSAPRYHALRARFEKCAGRIVEFEGERVDDLGARLLQQQERPDFALVPPQLLERAPRIILTTCRLDDLPRDIPLEEANVLVKHKQNERFLDEPVPLLEGRTPRQAATDPALRPALVRLMKTWVRRQDLENLRTGRDEDINWMLRELGLTEILFDPPPRRPAPQEMAENEPPNARSDEVPLSSPQGVMSEAEVQERLAHVCAVFPNVEDALDRLEAEAVELLDWLDGVVGKQLDDDEWNLMLIVIAQAWFVFYPPDGVSAPWDPDVFQSAMLHGTRVMLDASSSMTMDGFLKDLQSGRQPALTGFLAAGIVEAATTGRKRDRLRPRAVIPILSTLKMVVDALDQVVRG